MTVPAQAPLRSTVRWSGLDGLAGVRPHDVETSANGGMSWMPLLTAAPVTQTEFIGAPGQSYHFRVRAMDNVNNESGWVEAGPVEITSVTKYPTHGVSMGSMTIIDTPSPEGYNPCNKTDFNSRRWA